MLFAGLLGLAVYDLFLFNDAVVRPEALEVALFWRLGVTTSYGLAVLALIRFDLLSPRWREVGTASTIVVGRLCPAVDTEKSKDRRPGDLLEQHNRQPFL